MITCLHTAEVHVARFDRLFAAAGWSGPVAHIVRPELLARAQVEGVDAVREDVEAVLSRVSGGTVLCTCSTLGTLADSHANVVRIDRALMEAAAALGSHLLVVICLESTRGPTLDILAEVAPDATPEVLVCADAWAAFEQGDQVAFEHRIADAVRGRAGSYDAVVLAQASMDGAATLLGDLECPVLTSPALAVARAIDVASA